MQHAAKGRSEKINDEIDYSFQKHECINSIIYIEMIKDQDQELTFNSHFIIAVLRKKKIIFISLFDERI